MPGIIVREKTPGNYDVHIRGNDNIPPKGIMVYSENSISLVMIDGRPVYNYAFGGTFWETLPIELNDIERIEVVRGPSSALYGPNAVSGAINIITRTVTEKKLHADGQVQAGNINSKIANAGISAGLTDKLKIRVSGNYTHFDRFEDGFYVFDRDQRYSAQAMKTLTTYWSPGRTTTPVEENFDKVFPDTSLATNKYGANAFLSYEVNKDVNFNLSMGTQQSDVVSSTLGNNNIPIVGRTSNTKYIDLRSKVFGFQAQANYMNGDQFVQKEYKGWHIAPSILNATLEYEKTFGTLVLRPGISYQNTIYDDSKWGNAALRDGFLNGPKEVSSFAYFLRADYKLFEKLRLIGAIRGDKYMKPDNRYFTYQFVSSYDINENNVVRAVYSRANRGPFISDSYADYDWQVIPGYYTLQYQGNEKVKLPVLDMYEIGYRSKITKSIMLEIEAFHTLMQDIIFFTPDKMSLYFNLGPMTRGQAPSTIPYKIEGHGQYQNLDLKSTQNGITINLSAVITRNLNLKVFGTFQQTKLTGYYPRTIWQDFKYLQDASGAQYGADIAKVMRGDLSPLADTLKVYTTSYTTFKDSAQNLDHKSTPSFYGGLTVDYSPTKKWNVNTSFYFYSEQTFLQNKVNDIGRYQDQFLGATAAEFYANQAKYNSNDYSGVYTIEPKVIVNLKIAYKFWKNNTVFVNARNLLNNDKREFAYMDKVNGMYLVGLNFNF